jgi:hypothetical protein
MPREDAATKARRLLAEGRLTLRVLSEHVTEANVRGDSALVSPRAGIAVVGHVPAMRELLQAAVEGSASRRRWRPASAAVSLHEPKLTHNDRLAPRSSSRSMSNSAHVRSCGSA